MGEGLAVLRSLHARIVLLVVLALVPAALIDLWMIYEIREERQKELESEALRLSRLAAGETFRITEGARQMLATLAQIRGLWLGDSDERCAAFTSRLVRQFPQYVALYAAALDGSRFCAASSGAARPGVAGLPLFRTVVAERRFAIGEYATGGPDGRPVLRFGYPLLDDAGELRGVAIGTVDLAWFGEEMRNRSWPTGASVTVTDRAGTVLVRLPDGERVGQPIPEYARYALAAHSEAVIDGTGFDGRPRIIAYQPLSAGGEGLFVSVGLDPETIFDRLDALFWQALGLLFLALLVGIAAALLLGRTMIGRPLARLLAAARRWQEGDYAARARLEAPAEFTRLRDKLHQVVDRLGERERALSEANAARSRLLAVTGHDLRQPLQVLAFAIDRLRMRPTAAPDPSVLARADNAVARLARALDEVSEAARLDLEAVEPRLTIFPLEPLLREVLELWEPAARDKGLRLRIVPCRSEVESDREKLASILGNLVGNAVRYTDRGGIVVGCRPRGDRVAIEVCDSGIGIAPEQIETIFEGFRQIAPERREGLGLGLWIARQTAEILGHSLTVRSRPGRGSRFILELARASAARVGRQQSTAR